MMSHSKVKENVFFKLFLVIISLLLSWLQMSCSHNTCTISHAIPFGDFPLLHNYVPQGDITYFYLFFNRYLHSNNLHQLPDGKITLFIVDTTSSCK